MAEASYRIQPHPGAERECQKLDDDHDIDGLAHRINAAAARPQPTAHPEAKILKGDSRFFRIRCGDIRAICHLDKPRLLVLLVEERGTVYDRLDVAHQRAKELGVDV